MGQREKDVWREIFKLYGDLPCLWKTNHDHYHNKDMRSQAMLLLHEKYKTFDKDVALAAFKKKLENMRTSYGRERKKVMNSTQTGASSNDVYVPTLWYYELLTFLDEKDIAARNGEETEVSDDEDNISEVPPTKKKKMVSSFQKKQEQLLDVTNKIINAKEDDWEIIGRSIGVQLRDLSANQKLIARKPISDVIFYGSTEQLTNNIYMSIPSHSVILSPSPSPTSVPFPLSSPQYECNENQYIPQSPLPSTSQNTSQSNQPKIILKRRPKPSSTITSSSIIPSRSSSTSVPVPLSSPQYENNENQYIPQSPQPPTSQNTSQFNHPKIIIKRHPKPSSTSSIIPSLSPTSVLFPLSSPQYENNENQYTPQSPQPSTSQKHPKMNIKQSSAKKQQTKSQETNTNTNTISKDDSHDYSDHEESPIIYEGNASELGQFLLFNNKRDY